MENLEVWVKDKMERIGLNSDSSKDLEERENEEVRNGRSGSTISRRRGNYSKWGSEVSEDRLSNREVGKIKKWMMEKERDDRRCYIVIEGMKVEEGKDGKVWVQEFLKESLKVEYRIDKYWVNSDSGKNRERRKEKRNNS